MLERGFIAASNVKMDASDSVDTAVGDSEYIQFELMADGLLSPYLQKKKAALALLSEWKHINCQRSGCHDLIHDHVLRRLVQGGEEAGGRISFLFEKGSECEKRGE